jgi:hypothetical protein
MVKKITINGENIYFNSEKVAELQMKLSHIPLVPANQSLRKKRDKLKNQLLEEARNSGDVSKINLNAGYF